MVDIIVTVHAAERYVQRVNPMLTPRDAIAAILNHQRALDAAVRFGAWAVRLPNGARLIVKNGCVVTVLAKGCFSKGVRA